MTTDPDIQRLAVLVHELRSPVAALAVIAEAIGGADDPLSRQELVRLAISASQVIERVVTDASVASVRFEEVDVVSLVRDVVATAVLGGARVDARIVSGMPPVAGDPLRLKQALDNLVRNAVVHGAPDRTIVVTTESALGEVLLSISDSGPGIPADEHERVFEVGVRLDADQPGDGLGLSVTRAIVEAHGGRLAVSSALGEGATFTIVLPVAPGYPAARASSP